MKSELPVALFGSTGLIGGHVAEMLCEKGFKVRAFGRRSPSLNSQNLEFVQTDFEHLDSVVHDLEGCSAVVIALGTTLKQAGSVEAFRKVDLHYIVEAAKHAFAAGIPHAIVVSAVNADSGSMVPYSKTKGEMEHALRAVGFESLVLVKPSLLIGARDDRRLGEELSAPLMKMVNPLLGGKLRKYRAVEGKEVARQIVSLIEDPAQIEARAVTEWFPG